MPPTIRFQVSFAFFAFILIGANDGAFGVLIPSIRIHYGVNNATVGTLFLCSALGYLIAAFNSGPLAAKLGSQRSLLLGVGMLLICAGAVSLAPPFVLLPLLLLLIGFGIATLDAGLNSYIVRLPRSTALLNYLHAFYGVGALVGPLVAAVILAVGLTWNIVYIVWLVLALIVFCGILVTFRERVPLVQEGQSQGRDNLLLTVLRMRVVWFAALFLLFYVGTEVTLGSWSYSVLTIDRQTPTLFAGWIVSGYWLGLTIGRLVLARVALRVGEAPTIAGCVVGSALGVLLVWLLPSSTFVAAACLFFTGFCLGPIFPTTVALLSRVVASRWIGTAIGFLASLGSMGAALFPWIAGNLAQNFGLWSILPFVIVLALGMLLVWLIFQAHLSARQKDDTIAAKTP